MTAYGEEANPGPEGDGPGAPGRSGAEPVAVVGTGTMGQGIAQVAAVAGHQVLLHDVAPGRAELAADAVGARLDRLVEKGVLAADRRDAARARLRPVPELAGLADAELVVEAVLEELGAKQQLFTALESVVAPECLLATNTSSLSVTAVAAALRHPGRLVGLHFFNPAPLLPLVEVVSGATTDPAAADRAYALARAWGKTPVRCADTPGFVVNRVARPFYAEAFRVHEERGADPATIDAVLRESGGFAMGPFELTDLIGQDVNEAVTRSVWEAFFRDPRFAPSLAQRRLVESGLLGRKAGHGWYDHAPDAERPRPHTAEPCDPPAEVTVHGDLGPSAALCELISEAGIPVRYAAGWARPAGIVGGTGKTGETGRTGGTGGTSRTGVSGVPGVVAPDRVGGGTEVGGGTGTGGGTGGGTGVGEGTGVGGGTGVGEGAGRPGGVVAEAPVASVAAEASGAAESGIHDTSGASGTSRTSGGPASGASAAPARGGPASGALASQDGPGAGAVGEPGYLALPDGTRLALTDGSPATLDPYRASVRFDLALDYRTATRIAVAASDAAPEGALRAAIGLFQALGKQVSVVDDVPGLIVARTVAMLVNGAVDAVGRGVASPADVDTAMRLGVNYPRPPLAWGSDLGAGWVVGVLRHLHEDCPTGRYAPSRFLARRAALGRGLL